MTGQIELSADHLRAAMDRVGAQLRPTPLVPWGSPAAQRWNRLLVKAESLQPTGSFKVRGALHRIGQLTEDELAVGVIAYSTGNHAQAVAWAARAVGTTATIVMSPDAPQRKVDTTRALGGHVIMAEPGSDARRALAEQLADERGVRLVPPYDDLEVVAGQATVAMEIFDQLQDEPPAAIAVPVGGGGLLAGVAVATRTTHPDTQVVGVEPDLEADAWQSFQDGVLRRLDGPSDSIADAVKVQELGHLTWPLIRRHVDGIVTVTEAEIARACGLAAGEAHLVVEPSGALGIAAALADRIRPVGVGPIVVVATGGNTDLARLVDITAGLGSG